MTTIVAVENKDKTVIAADSQMTIGYDKYAGMVKIVSNGEYTFAAAGYARSLQILQFASLPPVPMSINFTASSIVKKEHAELDRFFTVEIIPAVRKAFEGLDSEAITGSRVLVVVKNRVYSVNGACGAWMRSENGYYAVGSGAAYALGALEAGADPSQAVTIAGRYDNGTNVDVMEVEI